MGCIAIINLTFQGGKRGILFYNIVVAVDQIQPFLIVELGQKPKNIAVYFKDPVKGSVFPKFIPIAQFNIGKIILVIVL